MEEILKLSEFDEAVSTEQTKSSEVQQNNKITTTQPAGADLNVTDKPKRPRLSGAQRKKAAILKAIAENHEILSKSELRINKFKQNVSRDNRQTVLTKDTDGIRKPRQDLEYKTGRSNASDYHSREFGIKERDEYRESSRNYDSRYDDRREYKDLRYEESSDKYASRGRTRETMAEAFARQSGSSNSAKVGRSSSTHSRREPRTMAEAYARSHDSLVNYNEREHRGISYEKGREMHSPGGETMAEAYVRSYDSFSNYNEKEYRSISYEKDRLRHGRDGETIAEAYARSHDSFSNYTEREHRGVSYEKYRENHGLDGETMAESYARKYKGTSHERGREKDSLGGETMAEAYARKYKDTSHERGREKHGHSGETMAEAYLRKSNPSFPRESLRFQSPVRNSEAFRKRSSTERNSAIRERSPVGYKKSIELRGDRDNQEKITFRDEFMKNDRYSGYPGNSSSSIDLRDNRNRGTYDDRGSGSYSYGDRRQTDLRSSDFETDLQRINPVREFYVPPARSNSDVYMDGRANYQAMFERSMPPRDDDLYMDERRISNHRTDEMEHSDFAGHDTDDELGNKHLEEQYPTPSKYVEFIVRKAAKKKAVIVPENFPEEIFSKSDVNIIKSVLVDHITKSAKHGTVPQFVSTIHDKGALVITCKNMESKHWVENVAPSLKAPKGYKMKVINFWDIPEPTCIKALMWVPRQLGKKQPQAILKLLSSQNPGLVTKHWRVQAVNKRTNEVGLILKINEGDIKALKKYDMKPSLGLGKAKFKLFAGKRKTFVE